MKIKVDTYPETFTFETRAKFPKFVNSGKNFAYCKNRNAVLLRALKRLNIDSPCHAYEDYVVESVRKTKDGEVWQLGS